MKGLAFRISCGVAGLTTLMAVGWSCSSSAPAPLPTVLVTNASCDSGRCTTLEIRAFVWKFTVPQWPSGLEILGEAAPGQTCITFPREWRLRIIGPDTTGRVDTASIRWTPDDGSEIYLVAVDSALYHAGPDSAQYDSLTRGLLPYFDDFAPGSVGETSNFSAGTAAGWAVSFPSAPVYGAKLTVVPACSN
jgi:hypothetical protein